MDQLLHALPVVGQCYKKTYFGSGERRNVSELVMPDDCVVNSKAKSIKTARRITHRLWFYSNDILERQRSGLWLDVDLGLPQSQDGDTDAGHEFLEQHCYQDLDGDGYKEPYIITVHRQSARVVRVAARWQPENVETTWVDGEERVVRIQPDHYFTHFGFIPNPDGSMNYLGFGQLLEPLNASANTALNQLLDAGSLYNAGGGFIGRGVRLRGGNWHIRPGEWKMVDVPGGALKENIVPLPVHEPSSVLFQLLGFLVQAGKEISSVQDILTGDAKLAASMPVGTAMALVEQGLKVFTAIYKRIYRSLTEEFRKLYRLNARYLDPTVTFYLSGHPEQLVVMQSDYREEDLTVVPVADPDLSSDMQRLLKAQALKDLSGRPGLNEIEVTRRLVRAVHPEDVDTVLLTDEQISGKAPVSWKPPPPPQLLLAQAKAMLSQARAQETVVRLQMDMARYRLETEGMLADIAKKKADAILSLAKADELQSGAINEQVRTHLEALKAEIGMIEGQIKARADELEKRVRASVDRHPPTNWAGGVAGLEEESGVPSGLPSPVAGTPGMDRETLGG
jgi:chaperonin GroES